MVFKRKSGRGLEDLTEGSRRHDPQAVGDLYDSMGAMVYSVILEIVRDPAIAEDLVQDTFVRVWKQSHQFSGDAGSLDRWLLAIARNSSIDYLRAIRRKPEQGGHSTDAEGRWGYLPEAFELPSGAADALAVRDAIRRLAPQPRRVIELAYYQGLSQTEIAERMGQPLGTIKTWTRGALKSLREAIDCGADSTMGAEYGIRPPRAESGGGAN
jgi:RNA polymerase sigma-70 factor (ECF subfamily)